MDEIADHTSERERRAVDAERDTDSLKKAQYMSDKIGEEFIGMVSSVTNFGIFVELENTVEGLVHISNMTDDYYRFDDRRMIMVGERTGRIFRIGDEVKVRVANVVIAESSIDFEIVGMVESYGNRPRKVTPKVITAGRTEKRGERSERRDRRGGSGAGASKERGRGAGSGDRKRGAHSDKSSGKGKDSKNKPFYEGVAKKGKKKKKKR